MTFSNDPKFSYIDVQLTGIDSNASAITGTVSDALKKHDVPTDEIDEFRMECLSGDYDNLLRTCMGWVNVY